MRQHAIVGVTALVLGIVGVHAPVRAGAPVLQWWPMPTITNAGNTNGTAGGRIGVSFPELRTRALKGLHMWENADAPCGVEVKFGDLTGGPTLSGGYWQMAGCGVNPSKGGANLPDDELLAGISVCYDDPKDPADRVVKGFLLVGVRVDANGGTTRGKDKGFFRTNCKVTSQASMDAGSAMCAPGSVATAIVPYVSKRGITGFALECHKLYRSDREPAKYELVQTGATAVFDPQSNAVNATAFLRNLYGEDVTPAPSTTFGISSVTYEGANLAAGTVCTASDRPYNIPKPRTSTDTSASSVHMPCAWNDIVRVGQCSVDKSVCLVKLQVSIDSGQSSFSTSLQLTKNGRPPPK